MPQELEPQAPGGGARGRSSFYSPSLLFRSLGIHLPGTQTDLPPRPICVALADHLHPPPHHADVSCGFKTSRCSWVPARPLVSYF